MSANLTSSHPASRPSLSSHRANVDVVSHSRSVSVASTASSVRINTDDVTPKATPGPLKQVEESLEHNSASESTAIGNGDANLASWVKSFVTLQPIREGIIAGVSAVTDFSKGTKADGPGQGPGTERRTARQLFEGRDDTPAIVINSPGSPMAYNQRLLGLRDPALPQEAEVPSVFSFSSFLGLGTVTSAIGSVITKFPNPNSNISRHNSINNDQEEKGRIIDDRKSMNLDIEQVTGETGSLGGGDEVFATPMASPFPILPDYSGPIPQVKASAYTKDDRVDSKHLSPPVSTTQTGASRQMTHSTTVPSLASTKLGEISSTNSVPSLAQLAHRIPDTNLLIPPTSSEASEASLLRGASPSSDIKRSPTKKSFIGRLGGGKSSAASKDEQSTSTSQTRSIPNGHDKVRYIKTFSKNKNKKDFDKLFLAQELNFAALPTINSQPSMYRKASVETMSSESNSQHRTHVENGQTTRTRPRSQINVQDSDIGPTGSARPGSSHPVKESKAIWAMKFSFDGRFLAVAGHDGIVRVFEVLSDPEERQEALNDSSTSKPNIMPVFHPIPILSFADHTNHVLDLAWSKNNFLLSSSMDKTVRLYHVTKNTCLATFLHLDFVTSVAFHPRDDRFFVSGSLDAKLRLWNIPEKKVHLWTELPELITSVNFCHDGRTVCVGTFQGACMLFESDTLKLQTSIMAKSSKSKNEKGRKITHIAPTDNERILITSNDSTHRLYSLVDRSLEEKYQGHSLTGAQIKATFNDNFGYVISGSEDKWVYIWESRIGDTTKKFKKRDKPAYEAFPAYSPITTVAIFAPRRTYEHLEKAKDPRFCFATQGNTRPPQETPFAQDCIIVLADDQTGIIRILRNSVAR